MATIYRGDNTGAFNNSFITIRAKVPEGQRIKLAKFKVGNLPAMTFENPEFPIVINLTSAQTLQLQQQNICYLAVYDELGRKATCRGTITFVAKEEVVR